MNIEKSAFSDLPFLRRAYIHAQQAGATLKAVPLDGYLMRGIASTLRAKEPDAVVHPFADDHPQVFFNDDLFILRDAGEEIGFLWLRNYADESISDITFGEIILVWIDPKHRGKGHWIKIDEFSKEWVRAARKTLLAGRCLKPSRRMAELFSKSGYDLDGPSPTGTTFHFWQVV